MAEMTSMETLRVVQEAGAAGGERKVLMRVYLVDGTHKTLYVDPEATTVDDLWRLLCEKLHLPESDWECFFIWGISSDLELLMYSDATIADLMVKWPALKKEYSKKLASSSSMLSLPQALSGSKLTRTASKLEVGQANTFQVLPRRTASGNPTTAASTIAEHLPPKQGGPVPPLKIPSPVLEPADVRSPRASPRTPRKEADQTDFKLVFRPTAVLPIEAEMAANSDAAVRLFYLQAVHDTVHSNYPTPKRMAVDLAAMQVQVSSGDHSPELHKPGFLRLQIDEYVPEHLRSKASPEEWERRILEQHKTLAGRSKMAVMQAYLQSVRGWKCYGSTFFKAKYMPAHHSFFKQPFEGHVVIGINRIGIHIVDSKVMAKVDAPIVVCPFKRVLWWDSDKRTFFFEFLPSADSTNSVVLTFKSHQADLINDLCHDWISEILHGNEGPRAAVREMAAIAAGSSIGAVGDAPITAGNTLAVGMAAQSQQQQQSFVLPAALQGTPTLSTQQVLIQPVSQQQQQFTLPASMQSPQPSFSQSPAPRSTAVMQGQAFPVPSGPEIAPVAPITYSEAHKFDAENGDAAGSSGHHHHKHHHTKRLNVEAQAVELQHNQLQQPHKADV